MTEIVDAIEIFKNKKIISTNLINRTFEYFNKFRGKYFIVKPSLPILYFGDIDAYSGSQRKIVTVGKNPSDNEFRLSKSDKYSFCRFPEWDEERGKLIQTLNSYFEQKPLKQWFSSFEPILNGLNSSFYKNGQYNNIAIHTDICSPLATNPTWSKLAREEQEQLFKDGFALWKSLIEELQPDIILISVPYKLFKHVIQTKGTAILTFDTCKDGKPRKRNYTVFQHAWKINDTKEAIVVYGQAANKSFDTISDEQKRQIGGKINYA